MRARAALMLAAACLAACRDGGAAASAGGGDAAQPVANYGPLEAALDPAAGRVRGRYREVRFEAARAGDGTAAARFWIEGGAEVSSTIEDARHGQVRWRDRRLRGARALSPDDAAALDELARSPLATALAAIPLDLACRPGADDLGPALGAALLLPWQMVLAYATDDVAGVVREAASGSECEHFRGIAPPSAPGRTPSPAVVALSDEQPLPVAAGYFPFQIGERP